MALQIGAILKARRKEKKMTLAQLAEQTGISISYLSLLERGLNSPTVENLNKVCAALDLFLSDLITKMENGSSIFIPADQRRTFFSGSGYLYETATDGSHPLSCIVLTILDMETHVSSPHITDEICYVASGSCLETVDGKEYEMSAGDCIYIEAHQRHSYRKTSAEPCVCVCFSLASSYADLKLPPR